MALNNFVKSFADFSWSLPVFALSQATKLVNGLPTSAPTQKATESFEASTDTITEQFGSTATTIYNTGKKVQDALIDLTFNFFPLNTPKPEDSNSDDEVLAIIADRVKAPPEVFPKAARSTEMEEAFSVYYIGKGKFDQKGEYLGLQVDVYDFNGRWLGIELGVYWNPPSPESPFAVPPSPPSPIDQPPVPHPEPREWTKGIFVFPDGSSISMEGPGHTLIVPLKDGALVTLVTDAQIVTSGTGVYEGVQGIKQGAGAVYIPPGVYQPGAPFPPPGAEIGLVSVDTFRLIRQGFLNTPAVSG